MSHKPCIYTVFRLFEVSVGQALKCLDKDRMGLFHEMVITLEHNSSNRDAYGAVSDSAV